MRTTWKPSSKKTKLTFLLSLTFLFLFSCLPQVKYVKDNYQHSEGQDWGRDYALCRSMVAGVMGTIYNEAFHHCLVGKGWKPVDEQGNPVEMYKSRLQNRYD